MENWHDLARENQKAALILLSHGQYRSMISRAYFAAYARATHALAEIPAPFPTGWEGPRHGKLMSFVDFYLHRLPKDRRQALSRMLGELYAMRIDADYRASRQVGAGDARAALNLMYKVFQMI